MTTNLDKLTDGIETDERIALALGWAGELSQCPRYSNSIEAAWQLVIAIQRNHWRIAINTTCDAGLYDITIGTFSEDLKAFTFQPLALGLCKAFLWCKTYNKSNQPDK